MATGTETPERQDDAGIPLLISPGLDRASRRLLTSVLAPVSRGLDGAGDRRLIQRLRAQFARRHWAFALVLYIAGAAVMQRHALAHPGTVIAGNLNGDPSQYMWAMWWWPHAIFSGVNPFVTHAIWVPDPYNLASTTSTPLPSLLFAPLNVIVGWKRGPVASYNLCMLIAPVLSAFLAYRLCLYLSKRPGSAILGGWLYGFCAYGLSQLQGHINLVFTFLPVVLILLTAQRLDDVVSRRRFIVLSAVALIAQVGIGTEILFTTTCLAIVAFVLALALAPWTIRGRLVRVVVPELIAGYVLAGIICSPYIYYALTGPGINQLYNSQYNIADLLSYVIPTPIVRIGQQKFEPLASLFPHAAGFIETGTYLGLPLIAGAAAFVVRGWRHWAARVLVVVTVVAFVWSLGPILNISGHGTIGLPWNLLDTKKEFDQISPVRLGMYVELGASIAFALWLARSSRWWAGKWLLALAAVAFLWPNTDGSFAGGGAPIYNKNVDTPAFFGTDIYRHYLTHNEVVLPIPFGPLGNALLWQSQTRGYFKEASGWFGYYPPDYANSQVIAELSGFQGFSDPVALTRQFLVSHHVGAVIIVPGQQGSWTTVMSQLGLKRIIAGGIWLYDVPASMKATA